MQRIEDVGKKYKALDYRLEAKSYEAIDTVCLLAFEYEYPGQEAQIVIDTDEFTALCTWTGLPDFGRVAISYVPNALCIELKSLKYYLLSYRDVGILQEHAANRILNDLVTVCQPLSMALTLDYRTRGGIHASVTVNYQK